MRAGMLLQASVWKLAIIQVLKQSVHVATVLRDYEESLQHVKGLLDHIWQSRLHETSSSSKEGMFLI